MTGPDGRLAMHRDFNVHPGTSGLERRLNVLLFLNETWDKEWGGVLYLGEHKQIEVMPLLRPDGDLRVRRRVVARPP